MTAEAGSGRVAVIGAGTMGRGIAHAWALHGWEVALYDAAAGQAEQALKEIGDQLAKGVRLGKVEPKARDAALSKLSSASSIMAAAAGATLVIEAVPEETELKKRVLREAVRAAPPEAVFATNTSALSVTELATALPRPGRFLGLHFFNPAHLMTLVEVVLGDATDADVAKWAEHRLRLLGKEPIIVRDSPGFASSRLGVALGMEAIRMVQSNVASPSDIDTAMVLGYRHPMGPLRLTDLVGLDVRLNIAKHLYRELGSETFRPPKLLERMVAIGRLGKKTGRGFYDWSDA